MPLHLQIESSEISAQISADGTVTFSDPPPQFTKEQVDMMLQQAQEQSALLARLEMDLTRSREYILKVSFRTPPPFFSFLFWPSNAILLAG
jgi:hypothetical protein